MPYHYLEKGAKLSADGRYRWWLKRGWRLSYAYRRALVIGYNPSTADAEKDDQTIRRLSQLLDAHGYDGFIIVNLFATRSTDPRLLDGPEHHDDWDRNVTEIRGAMTVCSAAVVAWGGLGSHEANARRHDLLTSTIILPLYCFGYTQTGAPRHPSRLPRSAKLERFKVR